jgi:hypothetical protein
VPSCCSARPVAQPEAATVLAGHGKNLGQQDRLELLGRLADLGRILRLSSGRNRKRLPHVEPVAQIVHCLAAPFLWPIR